jgi:hypothetical protein
MSPISSGIIFKQLEFNFNYLRCFKFFNAGVMKPILLLFSNKLVIIGAELQRGSPTSVRKLLLRSSEVILLKHAEVNYFGTSDKF